MLSPSLTEGSMTFNDNTSPSWNVTQASSYGSEAGFQVLLEGSGANAGQYLVWSTDVNGWKNYRWFWMEERIRDVFRWLR